MSNVPRVSIIIVNWNGRELLERCLASITARVSTPHEVIVVDNGSSDGTPAMVIEKFPAVKLIHNSTNRGFSAANNQGWTQAVSQAVFFLNADTELTVDPFPVLLENFERNDRIGAVAPRLLNPDGSFQASIRHWPRWSDQVITLLKLRHLLRRTPVMQRYYDQRYATASEPIDVDEIMGAAILARRETLVELGGWDEGYWIWFDDVDFCQRLHRAGWLVAYDPRTSLIHIGGSSFSQFLSLTKHVWFIKSLARYARKYWSPLAALSLWPFFVVSYLLTVLQTAIKPR